MKRFLIGYDGLSPENERLLHSYLGKSGSWWHWIPNIWLFACRDKKVTAKTLRVDLMKYSTKNVLVMEIVKSGEIAFRGTRSPEGASMGDWLTSTWMPADISDDDDIPF